ncbi:MAG: saccharopine dehydrogenase NADP-binding domain-containing protein [Ramlibacter sp.]
MKTVVLGGYGNFGARIARALADHGGIELVVAGRDLARAEALARELGASALRIDASAPGLGAHLAATGTGLVIHTAGPFQAQEYGVARAAAAAGCHYIDLADGRRFVCDFKAQLDGEFQRARRSAISGASTVPALSSAVVDEMLPRFASLQSIDICIAPAQQAPRGEATLAGVLSYCGAPIQVWREGRWQDGRGWSNPVPVTLARLKPRLGALCDIPDLELFPQRYAGVQSVMFRAALEVGASQRVFAVLSWLRQRGLLARPESLAGLLNRFGAVFDGWGTPAGGMVVRLRGQGMDDVPLQLAWHITAGGHHGPEIPCMAAILLARRLAAGEPLPSGARSCVDLLRLADFEPEFARWHMQTDLLEEPYDGS